MSVLALLALAPLAAPGPARAPEAARLPAQEPARDQRLAFNADSAARARAVLAAGPLDEEERATALIALGGGRALADVPRIESALADGEPIERRAALYAFGEMGAAGMGPLERALERASGLEETVCVALLVADERGAAGRARLEALAADPERPELAAAAARVLAWARAGDGGEPAAVAEHRELRWRAAREFGLVDGQRGARALATELFADPAFRARVVLRAASDLSDAELEPHVFELLAAGEDDAVLRLAAVRMPSELAHAHKSGEWRPSLRAWHVVLDALQEERAEARAEALLGIAFRESPELEPQAGLLLVRAGGDLPWTWIAGQLENGAPGLRAALAEACGDRGDKARITDLADLLARRPELGIFGEATVALARLGHPPARTQVQELVKGPASSEREQVVAALTRVVHDPNVRARALEALRNQDLPADLRLGLEVALAIEGVPVERERMRAALPASSGEERIRLVCALAETPEPGDVDALAAMFPSEGDRELDVELALVLVRNRHPAVDGLLRASLWGDPWNLSVLAGGVIAQGANSRLLLDELAAPPRSARESDLRRVGFALGEWGGIAAVEELARTRSESDPAVQGALLGALSSRAAEPPMTAVIRWPETGAAKPEAAPGATRAPGKGKGKGKGAAGKRRRKGG